MQTTKEAGQLMECACGMTGFGVETTEDRFQFDPRTFLITSKDNKNDAHECRFFRARDGKPPTRECLA